VASSPCLVKVSTIRKVKVLPGNKTLTSEERTIPISQWVFGLILSKNPQRTTFFPEAMGFVRTSICRLHSVTTLSMREPINTGQHVHLHLELETAY